MNQTPEEIAYDLCNRVESPGWGDEVQAAIADAIRAAELRGRIAEAERIIAAIEAAQLDPTGILLPTIRERIAELRKEG